MDKDGHVRQNTTSFVEGFYAAGEVSCSSVHGANRLGANSVLEALFFGRHVGKTMVTDLNKGIDLRPASQEDAQTMLNELKWYLTNNGKESVYLLREELQQSMTDNAGVYREAKLLKKQLDIIEDLKRRFKNIRIEDKSAIFNTELQEAIEMGHMLDYSKFIVEGALRREESRGAHFREDFAIRDDEKFLNHTMAYMDTDGHITQESMAVTLGKFEVKERTY